MFIGNKNIWPMIKEFFAYDIVLYAIKEDI